jgi:FK506-binding protein 4/5
MNMLGLAQQNLNCCRTVAGKESWEMDEEEKLSTAESCKLKGSHYFKLGKIPMAIKQYKRVSDYLDNLEDYKEEQRQKANAILLAAHLNLSMCYLKLNQSYECIQSADAALALDNSSVKVT